MKNFRWIMNRLNAMQPKEVVWRVKQKLLSEFERKTVYSKHQPVTEIPLSHTLSELHIDTEKLPINWKNENWTVFSKLDLFNVYEYDEYKSKWSAGFQTNNCWPEDQYSPTINISQRTDIGDIRTNWELNRHYQFAALAKSYYCTGDAESIKELNTLFEDWNRHNLFLHGVEWTSAMELAIRVNSWIYTLAFLKKANYEGVIIRKLERGILAMSEYILKHRARFSSANNHLIIEMYAVALVGILSGYKPWKDEALNILTNEMIRQNYKDGVNKEMSLHYQSFIMEAYGLLWILLDKNSIIIPDEWKIYLTAMAEFLADSTDDFGTTIEFGDNDEGKILDLSGKINNHYSYVLNLLSCVLEKAYTNQEWHENLQWIIPQKMRITKEKYIPDLIRSRREGGYSFLRSNDRRILIGIDHGDLGFGSIAAHGHSDALSFQIIVDGQPVFIDLGTYNYHFIPEERNRYRKTESHNTVVVNNKDQSEMLGPFLWGQKAKTSIINITEKPTTVTMSMKCITESYEHQRTVYFDRDRRIIIEDRISAGKGIFNLILAPESSISSVRNVATIINHSIKIYVKSDSNNIMTQTIKCSEHYNEEIETKKIGIDIDSGQDNINKVELEIVVPD